MFGLIGIGRWTTILIFGDNILCHFCFYNAIVKEAYFVVECPLYNFIKVKFLSLFENVMLGSFKSFFQLDHQVDISLYFTEITTLCHSSELVGCTPLFWGNIGGA